MKEHEPIPRIPLTLEMIAGLACKMAFKHNKHLPTVFFQCEGQQAQVWKIQKFRGDLNGSVETMLKGGLSFGRDRRHSGGLEQVFLVCEGWVSTVPKDKPLDYVFDEETTTQEALLVYHKDIVQDQSTLVIFEMTREDGILMDLRLTKGREKSDAGVQYPQLEAFAMGFDLGGLI